MFSTTADFLNYFGLEKLEELPDLPDIKEPKNLDLDLDNQSNILVQKESPPETTLN